MAKKQGHYCKVCGLYKSNESFSGKGHAAHICKKCAALPAAERSEDMTLTKLWNLPWQLSNTQRDWLKGLRNDNRPEIANTAKELYADRFPHAARNERKQQLHIRHMELSINGEVFDEYGDWTEHKLTFVLDREAYTVLLRENDEENRVILTSKAMRKLLNVIVNNYEVFCWHEDYGCSDNSDETDELWDDDEMDEGIEPIPEETPSWSVSVSYLNGESQEMCGYGDLPDRVNDLTLELLTLFEDEDEIEDSEE